MAAPMKLALVLSAFDKASAVINEMVNKATSKLKAFEDKTKKMSEGAMNFGKSAITMGVTAGASLLPAVTSFAEAEDAATRLKTTMMDASGQVSKDFTAINELANKLGGKLPGTTADFQNMMAKLVQQGISTKAILGGVGEAAAYIGVQMKMPFEQAAEFAAKLQDATRTTEGDMLNLMDTIQKAYNLGVDPQNMQQGFSKLSAAMEMIKLRGLEGANALAPLLVMADQAAMAGEAAGNAYRKVFQASFNKGKLDKANATMSKFGINLQFTDSKGEFAGIENFISQLEKLKKLDTTTRTGVIKQLFGDDAETLQVVALLMEKGNKGYQDTLARMNSQASLQQRVNAQLGTLKNTWDAATGALTNMLASFGELLAPTLKSLADWFGELSQKMQAWIKENPGLARAIGLGVMAFAGLATVLGTVGLLFGGVTKVIAVMTTGLGVLTKTLGMVAKAFMFVGKTMLVVGRFMMANPILAAVMAIATAVYLIYQYWGEIVAWFKWLWEKVTGIFGEFWDWLTGWVKGAWDIGVGFVHWMWDGIKSVFWQMAKWIDDTIEGLPIIGWLYGKGKAAVRGTITDITSSVEQMAQKLSMGDPEAVAGLNKMKQLGYDTSGIEAAAAQINATNAAPVSKSAVTNSSSNAAINYQPQITINGAMSSGDKESFAKMLKENERELSKLIEKQNSRFQKRSFDANTD